MMNERKIVIEILYDIFRDNAYTNLALNKAFKKHLSLSQEQKNLVSELVCGVTERKITLDYIISSFSSIKINKISLNVLNVLRSGVYQLLFLDRIPASAAVNESVKLAKTYGGQRSTGFVNAVLRNIERNKGNLAFPKDKIEFLSVYYSYPQKLTNLLVNKFGYEFCEDLFESFNKRFPLTVRCNTLKTTPEKLVDELSSCGAKADFYVNDRFMNLDYALEVSNIKNLEKINPFTDGKFYVQDISTMLTTEALNPQKGDLVIDVCAAPGGKTTHIAEKMMNTGKILAFDIYEHRLELINENLKRLGITNCDTCIADSTVLNEKYINSADRVLVDAPCSGLGIIGKKPDIKYQRTPEDIEALAETGFTILSNASRYVKPGGTLVYSTCTIIDTENEDVVNRFLESCGGEFSLEPLNIVKAENPGYITLYPNVDGVDGFFICKLKKR